MVANLRIDFPHFCRMASTSFALGSPVPLFELQMLNGPRPALGYGTSFDVAKDGRFLVNVPVGDAESPPITVVVNWAAGRKK
jgi:hypothetical protein